MIYPRKPEVLTTRRGILELSSLPESRSRVFSERPQATTRLKLVKKSGSSSRTCSTDSCLLSPLTSWFISSSSLVATSPLDCPMLSAMNHEVRGESRQESLDL